ncbi:ABC transporter substrate-binding protein [Bradyrhizobium vignae]|uniref:ABC transporter substrate-binding protein n=1 Tax=Bradyrhizobium vignae TaxID=1549949 RepID=A0ABS4A235_9BRAD|nr:ABC transporter substrate-binding protein [Bradyrhizobium vignae]MBP0114013.1 ABC transporter substrate-binding protein [Bradyrhizobium vignae]RXG92256.1 branched-chain amino acid ABC transporter substrate-binding protein [Bradyrhizobium vignae]
MRYACSSTFVALSVALLSSAASAQKQYDPGASDTEIKVGNLMPYSGPGSAYSVIGKVEAAYFEMINKNGGINGRKINFISYDHAYSPPKAVEQVRKLVESDEVLLTFNILGTAHNAAVQKYLNGKKVPQLFVASGAERWNDPAHFPWTMGWQPSYQAEGRIYGRYVAQTLSDAKIGILWQNDDSGRDYVKGFVAGLGGKFEPTTRLSYEITDPTIDPQMSQLKASGANVFFDVTSPKFAAQAIRKTGELQWRPLHILNNVSTSVAAVLKPAGLDNAKGVISTAYLKNPLDPAWSGDEGYRHGLAFMNEYMPGTDKADSNTVYGYSVAQTLAEVLKMCGDDLTRENVMKKAASLKDLKLDMLLPGITINTSPTDFAPIKQEQLIRFDGEKWERFGPDAENMR